MGVNVVKYNGNTLIDLSSDTLTSAEQLADGVVAHTKSGDTITGTLSGGGLPTGFTAIATGTYAVTSAFTTSKKTVTHDLGVVPDMVLFYYPSGNIAQTYTMLWAMRNTQMGFRSSAYTSYYGYHGNSTTTVTSANSNSTSYGVSNLTSTTFQIASHSTSYYWRAGTYKWVAIKF